MKTDPMVSIYETITKSILDIKGDDDFVIIRKLNGDEYALAGSQIDNLYLQKTKCAVSDLAKRVAELEAAAKSK